MHLEHDDDFLDLLPELDIDGDDPTGTEDAAAEPDLLDAEASESVGLDDTTGARDPVDLDWLDPMPEDAAGRVAGEAPLAEFDLADEIDDEESQSWLEGASGDKSWDADLNVAEEPLAYVDDGGVLGLDDPVRLPDLDDDPALRIGGQNGQEGPATPERDGIADESGAQSG